MFNNQYVEMLSSKHKCVRRRALKKLASARAEADYCDDTLLSIHTDYSFSPYSPSLACFMADKFGLRLAGIMDNYTIEGADEFIKASRILGVTYSTGVQVRASFDFLDGAFYNVAIMGIAKRFFKDVQKSLAPFRQKQMANVTATCDEINNRFSRYGVTVDCKKDVFNRIPKAKNKIYLSKYAYMALSEKLKNAFSKERVCQILKELGFSLTDEELRLLTAENNIYYVYDLANALFKYREKFSAKKDYCNAVLAVSLARGCGAICTFEYETVDYIEDNENNRKKISFIIDNLKNLGFNGFSFDPSKMADGLKDFVYDKLESLEMLPFLLSPIEFPRQDFQFHFTDEKSKNLMKRSAYVVVGSEMSENQTGEGFVNNTLNANFNEKVLLFAKIGRGE